MLGLASSLRLQRALCWRSLVSSVSFSSVILCWFLRCSVLRFRAPCPMATHQSGCLCHSQKTAACFASVQFGTMNHDAAELVSLVAISSDYLFYILPLLIVYPLLRPKWFCHQRQKQTYGEEGRRDIHPENHRPRNTHHAPEKRSTRNHERDIGRIRHNHGRHAPPAHPPRPQRHNTARKSSW